MSDHPAPVNSEVPAGVPQAPPDSENQALKDAWLTYVITLVGAALFIASVFVFIL